MNERDALCGFLDQARDALVRKVQGVSEVDARRVPTASSLSLLGVLKHAALWERRWFQVIGAGRTFPHEWPESESKSMDEDFLIGDQETVEYWLAYYINQAAISRQITAEMQLGDPCARQDLADHNLRWLLLHMIQETARHVGHADIIRETLDGSRGL